MSTRYSPLDNTARRGCAAFPVLLILTGIILAFVLLINYQTDSGVTDYSNQAYQFNLALNGNFSSINQTQFAAELAQEIATDLHVSPNQVYVIRLVSGSILADVVIGQSPKGTPPSEQLVVQFFALLPQLNTTRSFFQHYSIQPGNQLSYTPANPVDLHCGNTYSQLCLGSVNNCSVDPGLCRNGGVCVPEFSSSVLGYQCNCAPGFNLTNCTGIVNYCDPNPCGLGVNPGAISCTSFSPGPVNYTCGCASGYFTLAPHNSICVGTFNSTWNTTTVYSGSSNASSIFLPLVSNGQYNAIVNWGDGKISTITNYTQNNHTYAIPGIYNISIGGLFQGFSFNNAGDRLKLLSISQFGGLSFANNGNYFYGCSNLQITATDILNLTGVTTMANMFYSCTALTTIPSANSWNTEAITDMSQAFRYASNFNQSIGNWNTQSVTSFSAMFYAATVFNQPIGNWNLTSALDIGGMFETTSAFNQNIGNWNTGNVTSMGSVFKNTVAFNQPISNWNTSSVTTMTGMFYNSQSFNQFIGNWSTGLVTNMALMFYTALQFNQPIGSWNMASVNNMQAMFQGATAFNQPIGNWNTAQVTNMQSMFEGPSVFNQDIHLWNVSQVTNMANMFYGGIGSVVFNQNISSWDVRKVTSLGGFFTGSTFGTPNYNSLLTGWLADNSLPGYGLTHSITLSMGSSVRWCNNTAYTALTTAPISWTITDGGCV